MLRWSGSVRKLEHTLQQLKSNSSTAKNHLDDLATDRTDWLVYRCKESGSSKLSIDRKLFNLSLAVNDRQFRRVPEPRLF